MPPWRRSRTPARRATSSTSGTSANASTSRAVNRRAIEALIKSGAFGSTGHSRKGMLDVLEQAQAAGSKVQQDALLGQASIFDFGGEDSGPSVTQSRPPVPTEEFDHGELLEIEKEALGLFVSEHPLKRVSRRPARRRRHLHRESRRPQGRRLDHDRRHHQHGAQDPHALGLEHDFRDRRRSRGRCGDRRLSRQLESFEHLLQPTDKLVIVRGKLEHKDGGKVSVARRMCRSSRPPRRRSRRPRSSTSSARGAARRADHPPAPDRPAHPHRPRRPPRPAPGPRWRCRSGGRAPRR